MTQLKEERTILWSNRGTKKTDNVHRNTTQGNQRLRNMSLTKQRGELGSSGKISNSKKTNGIRSVTFVKNPVIIPGMIKIMEM